MTKLTDAQLTLLRAVAKTGTLAPPSQRPTKAVATRLLAMGYLTRDEEGSLELTEVGRVAVEPPTAVSPEEPTAQEQIGSAKAPKGKLGLLVTMLQRSEGATIAQISEATGWQAHSVRGAISGAIKKKLGFEVASEVSQTGRVYRIVETGQ